MFWYFIGYVLVAVWIFGVALAVRRRCERRRIPTDESGPGCDSCWTINPESALYCRRCGKGLPALTQNPEAKSGVRCGACRGMDTQFTHNGAAVRCRSCGKYTNVAKLETEVRPALPQKPPRDRPDKQRPKRESESPAAIWCPKCRRYSATECGSGKAQCDCTHVFGIPIIEDKTRPLCRCGESMAPVSVGWYCSRCGNIQRPESSGDVVRYNRAVEEHAKAMASLVNEPRRRGVCPNCRLPKLVKHPFISEYRQCVGCGYAECPPGEKALSVEYIPCDCGDGYMIPFGLNTRRCVTCGKHTGPGAWPAAVAGAQCNACSVGRMIRARGSDFYRCNRCGCTVHNAS
jgi:hypothetical protein